MPCARNSIGILIDIEIGFLSQSRQVPIRKSIQQVQILDRMNLINHRLLGLLGHGVQVLYVSIQISHRGWFARHNGLFRVLVCVLPLIDQRRVPRLGHLAMDIHMANELFMLV